MKKILIEFTLFIILFNNMIVFGNESNRQDNCLLNYEIINKKEFYNEKITRGECITSILKIIGVSEELVEYYENHVSFYCPVFDDLPIEYNGYIVIAGAYKIALGEASGKHRSKFYPERNVTLKECLTFMLRCLHKENSYDVMSQAKADGLIKDTDEFLENETLSYDEFYLLLYRMFYHERGYYFDWKYTIYDEEYTKLYFDDKTQRYNGNFLRYADYYDLYKSIK